MTDETATGDFNLDAALESAYATVTNTEPEKVEAPEVAETETTEAEKPEVKETSTSGAKDKAEAAKPIEPPVSWTAEAKEKFSKLPPDVQEYITQRESEREKLLTQKSTEYSEQQRRYEALEQVISPRRDALAANYGSEAQALSQLFQLSDFADRDPVGFVKWFAQQRGIDLQNAQPVADEYLDPATKQLQTEIQKINQTLTVQQQQQEQAKLEKARNEITLFKDAKDESGNLLRPYFDEVREEMRSLIQSGAAKNLDHAYDMAKWANATVREKIQADQKKAEEKSRIEAAKEAAAKAEKAKGVVSKSKKAGENSSKKGSWEDTLSDTAEELYGAA